MKRPSRWPIALALLSMALVGGFLAANLSADEVALPQSDARGIRAGLALSDPDQADRPAQSEAAAVQADSTQASSGELDRSAADAAIDNPPPLPTAVPLAQEPLTAGTALDWVLDEVGRRAEIGSLRSPANGCVSVDASAVVLKLPGSPSRFQCPVGNVAAVADGRVLMAVGTEPASALPVPTPGQTTWEWARGAELGRFVVIDHGPIGTGASAISVYSRLGEVAPALTVGTSVLAGEVIGSLGPADAVENPADADEEPADADEEPAEPTGAAGLRDQRTGEFMFEFWIDDEFAPPEFQVDLATATQWASILGEVGTAPADRACGFPAGVGSLLPNAPRQYRAGVHRGIDFNCGRGNDAYAYMSGTVVLVVDDFTDPTVAARESTLSNAAAAGATPHWILMMLYGNVVVIDHGDIPGVGRVTTISAHLDSVDPSVAVGVEVATGQRLGEIGNAGTNAGALGSNATVHLHWELFVDGTHLAKGLSASDTSSVYATALCRIPESLNGC